jgi:excisionase family DNA binding protein
MNSNYKTRKEVCDALGIHYITLYKLAEKGEIETIKIGDRQYYNLNKYMSKIKMEKVNKKNICYCRVSSQKQKEDLNRQINFMKEKYKDYSIIKDIGSGLNFNRPGLKEIINLAIKGEINEIIITYKDRLARFGFELIENLIKEYSNGKITILNKDEEATPTEELTKDIVSIMNVYVAKVNGLRKYKNKIKETIKKTPKNTKKSDF